MSRQLIRAIAHILVGGFTVPALAHHSAAPHYDLSREISITGVVSRFEFVNPHAYVYFTVSQAGGAPQPWRCELLARATLSRLGWTPATLTVGQKLTFKAAPALRRECLRAQLVRARRRRRDRCACQSAGGRFWRPRHRRCCRSSGRIRRGRRSRMAVWRLAPMRGWRDRGCRAPGRARGTRRRAPGQRRGARGGAGLRPALRRSCRALQSGEHPLRLDA